MNSVEGKKILITGGAGFIGSATADQLLDAGATEVRVLDNFVRGSMRNLEGENKRANLVVIEGDIMSFISRRCESLAVPRHRARLSRF
jgi:UDP-glucose 4-epimerase